MDLVKLMMKKRTVMRRRLYLISRRVFLCFARTVEDAASQRAMGNRFALVVCIFQRPGADMNKNVGVFDEL